MEECKHLLKYNSTVWTCGLDQQGADKKSHCGRDVKTGEYIIYRHCPKYEPVKKQQLSIAERIIRDAGFVKK